MKLALSFLSGVVVCSIMLFGVQAVMPLRAGTVSSNTTSDNFSLVHLLPDIEKIYQEALIMPFEEAEKKIYDDDIARFYRLLIGKAALERPSEENPE